MLILRIKQCEHCLADGRLEEAFELARQADFRSHRRGQELVNQLVKAFIGRSRQHLAAGRLPQANADCQRAAHLGGNQPDIAQLSNAIQTATSGVEKANMARGRAVAAARQLAAQGQLSVGQQILEEVAAPDAQVDGLKNDLARRRAAIESCCKKASESLANNDWQGAITQLLSLGRTISPEPALRQICAKISEMAVREIDDAVETGRLEIASSLLASLQTLPVQSAEAESIARMLGDCRNTYAAIESGKWQEAKQTLHRIQSLSPKAKWIAQAVESVEKMEEAWITLGSGPLSLVTTAGAAKGQAKLPAIPLPPPIASPSPVGGQSFCLHVDGVGSFRVLTAPSISLGPVGSSRSVDLPLMLDAALPAVKIVRSDEDYFVQSPRPVWVNDASTTNGLLNHGDKIGLGSRCRITFRRPSAASTTAVLDLSGTRMPGAGIRQVVLMDRELIIGSGEGSHIRCDELDAPVVLQRRGQSLVCRSTAAPISIDEKPAGQLADLSPGAHVSVGKLRFVIAREEGT